MEQKTRERSYKQMLWISMISMTMMFAGLTSAYVVSKGREDWVSFDLPSSFYLSTLLIVLSSVTFVLAKRSLMAGKTKMVTNWLLATLVLGVAFVFYQFNGFGQLIDAGLYTTGPESNVSSSFLYVITATHLIHIFAGILVLIRVVYRSFKNSYSPESHLGLTLSAIFWHFVDALWIYLFAFFYFIG